MKRLLATVPETPERLSTYVMSLHIQLDGLGLGRFVIAFI
jgi:hypothetical protein